MRYVDVFISHKMEDATKARALGALIKKWGFSYYIDAIDAHLRTVRTPRELADRIRENLRTCRCLIYAFSSASVQSKWMPWELGFFDGRWGSDQILLYNLSEERPKPSKTGMQDRNPDVPSIQEYLQIYLLVTKDRLRDILADRCSTRVLANRADVDVDRFAALSAAMWRNPLSFWIGCVEFAISVQQQIARQMLPSDVGSQFDVSKSVQSALRMLRQNAEAWGFPKAFYGSTDETVGSSRDISERAIIASR